MTRKQLFAFAAAVLIAVTGLSIAVIRRREAAAEERSEATPTALITTAAVRRGPIQNVVQANGVVRSDPTGSVTVAAPRAAIVVRTLVHIGEPVTGGQPLIEITDAPASVLAYRQAADAETAAEADLARVQRLYDQRLAASDQLIAAQKTLADARAALAAQLSQGSGRAKQMLDAPATGVVTSVAAAAGDHVGQDAALVTLARAGAAVVKIALEPSSGEVFAPGQAVTLTPTFGGRPAQSRLTMVGRAADPATRMIDATAPAPPDLTIGAPVRAEVVTGVHEGLLAPRAAVVFDETGAHVFVVSNRKANRVFVTVGGDHGDAVEISGAVAANAVVAVEGAYELQDGMAVRVRGR